ncbi:MAG TPA: cupin domain-containing protein [Burkholderiales bacterium]|jgi:mannose-6-phosphate isomerase-like protein (cupin superfamily)
MSAAPQVHGREEQNPAYTVSSRKWVAEGSDVHVKEFNLGVDEEVPWHHHTEVFDVFYCLEGRMRIQRQDIFSNEALADFALAVGDSAKVEPGTAHRVSNPGPGRLRFVIIQGIGRYDFKPFEVTPR